MDYRYLEHHRRNEKAIRDEESFKEEYTYRPRWIVSRRTKFAFGKYKKKTGQWVLNNDPGYIVWVSNNIKDCLITKALLRDALENNNKGNG
jgi:hypothetical protein